MAFLAIASLGWVPNCDAYKPDLIVQTGHSGLVYSVVISADGKTIASGSYDKTIKLWDVASGKELRTLAGHSGWVISVALSMDGNTLVSGSWDKTIKIWDLASGKERRTLTGHSGLVSSVAISDDGNTLASGSYDTTIKLWDVASGKEIRSLSGHSKSISSVVICRDGKTLASGSADRTIKLWDVASGKEVRTLVGHSGSVSSVTMSRNGKILASGSADGNIKLWDIASGKELRTLVGHSASVTSVAMSADGKTLVSSGGRDKTIKLWDIASGKELRTLVGHLHPVYSVAMSANGQTIASGCFDKTIKLWDVASGHELRILSGHSRSVSSVTMSRNGKILASDSYSTIKLWDVAFGKELRTLTGHSNWVLSVEISADGKMLASGSQDKNIKLWDIASGKELRTLAGHSGSVLDVAISVDGKTLASGSADKNIKLWDIASGRELRTLACHSDSVNSVVMSADGKMLASGSDDKTIRLWEIASGKVLRTMAGHTKRVVSVGISADGKTLASGSWDNTVKIWDVASGKELRTLTGHSDWVTAVAISADGKMLASGSEDKTIKLWDVASGKQLRTLAGHSHRVNAVALSADGQTLVSGSADTKVKLWQVPLGQEISSLCSIGDSDWTIVTRDGRYDASPGAMKMMHYNLGNEVVELDRFKDYFYEPQLLPKLLGFSKEPLYKIPSFDDIKLAPDVSYQFDKAKQKLSLKLKDRGGGFGRVQVKINDAVFEPDAEFVVALKNANGRDEVDLPPINVSKSANISPGTSPGISIVAYPKDERLVSRTLTVESASPREVPPFVLPELYAVIIGVSEYAKSSLNLRFSAKDARDFESAIKLAGEKHFGKDRVHVKLLATGGTAENTPTKENIQKAFVDARKSKPDDILLVYLAGHGVSVPIEVANGGQKHLYCYLTSDARMTDLSTPEIREQTSITSDDLRNWMKANVMPARKKVLILDTCAAGSVVENLSLRRNSTGNQEKAVDDLKDKIGFHVLMGCTEDAVSYEAGEFGQGLLTYSLLEGMTGPALLSDAGDAKKVFVNELFDYATKRVPKLATGIGGIQEPRFLTPENSTNFWIGQVGPNEISKIPLAARKPRILKPVLINLDDVADDALMVALRKQLEEDYSTLARGDQKQNAFIYIPADECPGAFTARGTFRVDGNEMTFDVTVSRDKKKIGTAIRKAFRGTQEEIIAQLSQEIFDQIKSAER